MELLQVIAGGLIGALIGYGLTTLSLKLFGPAVTMILICAAVLGIVFSGDASAADTVTAPVVTLQDSLVSIINQVQSGVSAGVSFLQAEIPDVIRQLLVWKALEAIFWAVFELGLFILSVVVGLKAVKSISATTKLEAASDVAKEIYGRSGYRDEDGKVKHDAYVAAKAAAETAIPFTVATCIVAVVLGIVGAIAFCSIWGNVLTALQIWIAPKVWLIEYAAHLVK